MLRTNAKQLELKTTIQFYYIFLQRNNNGKTIKHFLQLGWQMVKRKITIHNQALKWISRYQGINKFQPGTKTGWFTAKNIKLNVLKIKTSRKRLIHNCWFCMLWINKPDIYPLVTIQRCAVSMEMYRVSAIALLHNANFQAASHCCLYKSIP